MGFVVYFCTKFWLTYGALLGPYVRLSRALIFKNGAFYSYIDPNIRNRMMEVKPIGQRLDEIAALV